MRFSSSLNAETRCKAVGVMHRASIRLESNNDSEEAFRKRSTVIVR